MNPATRTTPSCKSKIPAFVAIAAGLTFTLASAATNLTYAVARATTLPEMAIWGAVAVAASLVLALAPSALVATLQDKRYGAATLALVAAVIFGTYSTAAALGSATGGRIIAGIEADDLTKRRTDALSAIQTHARELASFKTVRTVSELEAAIGRELASRRDLNDCVGWLPSTQARTVCVTVSEMRAEKARAQRKEALEGAITEARETLATLPARKTVANTDAAALQGFARALGWNVDTDTLNRLLVILAVLVIELGGGLAFAVARGLRVITPEPAPFKLVISTDQSPPSPSAENPATTGPRGGDQRVITEAQDPKEKIMAQLRASAGVVQGSQRRLAQQIGVSQSRVHQLLQELATDGLVKVRVGTTGTTVQLVSA